MAAVAGKEGMGAAKLRGINRRERGRAERLKAHSAECMDATRSIRREDIMLRVTLNCPAKPVSIRTGALAAVVRRLPRFRN
jgi:hypothetical protein